MTGVGILVAPVESRRGGRSTCTKARRGGAQSEGAHATVHPPLRCTTRCVLPGSKAKCPILPRPKADRGASRKASREAGSEAERVAIRADSLVIAATTVRALGGKLRVSVRVTLCLPPPSSRFSSMKSRTAGGDWQREARPHPTIPSPQHWSRAASALVLAHIRPPSIRTTVGGSADSPPTRRSSAFAAACWASTCLTMSDLSTFSSSTAAPGAWSRWMRANKPLRLLSGAAIPRKKPGMRF